LKEGFGLEQQRWGRDAAAAHCRTTLTLPAFNTAQVDRGRGGERLAKLGDPTSAPSHRTWAAPPW
jgi:hypothetical protein